MMTIEVACNCGAKFNAKPELAGKRVKCPSCAQPFTIPLPTKPLRVSCKCGQAFAARHDLAGETVKCPSCGGPLTVPSLVEETPAALEDNNDPLGLGDISSGLGNLSAHDPLLSDGALPTSGQPAVGYGGYQAYASAGAAPSTAARRKRPANPDSLIVMAGYVSVLFGLCVVILESIFLLWFVIAAIRSGSPQAIFSTWSVWKCTYVGLAAWMAKSGIEIIRNESRRQALQEAGKASIAFVVLGLAGLVAIAFVAVLANSLPFGLGALVGALSLVATALLIVKTAPPAFVLYVARRVATGESGFRNPVVLGATIALPLIFVVFGSLSFSGTLRLTPTRNRARANGSAAPVKPTDPLPSRLADATTAKSQLELLTAAVERDSDDPKAYKARGDWYAQHGNWKEAAADLKTYSAAIPDDDYVFRMPVLLLKVGDLEGYHAGCSALLKRFSKTSKPELAERTIKSCLASAPKPDNLPRIVALAERAVKMPQANWLSPYMDFAQAICAYRNGDDHAAIKWADRCLKRSGSSSVEYRTAQCRLARAMAWARLKEHAKARADLQAAVVILDLHKAAVDKSGNDGEWKDWLIAESLRAEAEATLQPEK